MIKFKSTSPMGSDCTEAYDVETDCKTIGELESYYNNVATYTWTGRIFEGFEDARNTALVKHCVYYAIPYRLTNFQNIYGFNFKFD